LKKLLQTVIILLTTVIERVIHLARAGLDKDKVVMKAAELASECGLNNLSLKDLADSLGIKPQSLYNHIKSLDELKHAMMLFAARQLTKDVTVAAVGKSGEAAVRSVAKAYYLFAINNSGLYEAMQWYNRLEDEEAAREFTDFMLVVEKVLEPYNMNDRDEQNVYCLLRSLIHGFASLAAFGGFGKNMPIEEHFDWAINAIVSNLNTLLENNH